MQLNSSMGCLMLLTSKHTLYHSMKTKHLRNSLRSNLQKGIFDHQNLNTHHHSLSSKSKMENYDQYKTTMPSISGPFITSTPYPSYSSSFGTSVELISLLNSTFDGNTIIFVLKGDEHKAVFKMQYRLFEPTGLTNSPAAFQTMMNFILCPLIE